MTLNQDLAHGQNYKSGGQEFESLRARHLSSSHVVDFQNGLKCAQTKICV